MSEGAVKTGTKAVLGVWIAPALLAALVLYWPRPVPLGAPPGLVLDARDVEAVLARDQADAQAFRPSDELEVILSHYRALSRAQLDGDPLTEDAVGRSSIEVGHALDRVGASSDPFRAARAHLLERLAPALAGTLPDGERRDVLGDFTLTVGRFGLEDGGRLVAPRIVVRTLFKARFNGIVGLPPTHALADVELLAYWGWLALGARGVDPARRLAALAEYRSLGGARADEAEAALLVLAGRFEEADEVLGRLDATGLHARYRNARLAIREALEAE